MNAEPCSGCQTAAWYRWHENQVLMHRAMPEGKPRLCDRCRESLGRIAAQYRPKEVGG